MRNKFLKICLYLIVFVIIITPKILLACSCGSSVLDVGTASLLPTSKGGLLFAQYDYVDQNSTKTHTKETQLVTIGGQYLFNRKWGVAARVPYVMREEFNSANGTVKNNSLGDIKINGIYSGLSDDMSSGIIFGAKLPTGATKQAGFERDTQIGTGSYDLIIGFYKFGKFSKESNFGWFSQINLQKPVITQKSYRTGDEISASIGSFYDLGQMSSFSKVTPMFQFILSDKKREKGYEANLENGSYRRLFIAPGVEGRIGQYKIYADIQLPIYSDNGGQLAIEKIFRLIVSHGF